MFMVESQLAKPTPLLLQHYHRQSKMLFTQPRAGGNGYQMRNSLSMIKAFSSQFQFGAGSGASAYSR
jgi:hypothetical protein